MTQTLNIKLRMTSDRPAPSSYPATSHPNSTRPTGPVTPDTQNGARALDNLVILVPLSPGSLDKFRKLCKTVHYHPDRKVPNHVFKEGEVWFTGFATFPEEVKSVDDVPKAKVVQLSSAGANWVFEDKVLSSKKAQEQIAVCNASGIHVFSIPQYIVSQVINLYMYHQIQFDLLRSQKKWPSRPEMYKAVHPHGDNPAAGLGSRSLYGKTAGFLGYGHIGREAARTLKAMNVEIIAANSSGQKKADEGYIVPGTGDPDGSLPSAWYSTTDPSSFKTFLGRCDILVASLPSTPATHRLLRSEHLDALPDRAILINVGRGDLVSSDDLLSALSAPHGLESVALDVTDPEPLPDNHPFFTHPRVIVTPHTSGGVEGYLDKAADLLVESIERVRRGGGVINKVDWKRGY